MRTHEENRQTDADLIDLVLEGKKPGANVDRIVYDNMEKERCLENIISTSPFLTSGGVEAGVRSYLISVKGRKVSDAITPMDAAFYSDLDDAQELYLELEDLPIHSALQKLSSHQKMSIATECLIGELLGYEPCCVRYFAETRWMGRPEHDLDIRKNQSYHNKVNRNPHILCRDCEERGEYVTEFMKAGSKPVQ